MILLRKERTDDNDDYRNYSNCAFGVSCIYGLCHRGTLGGEGEIMDPIVTVFVILWLVGVLSG